MYFPVFGIKNWAIPVVSGTIYLPHMSILFIKAFKNMHSLYSSSVLSKNLSLPMKQTSTQENVCGNMVYNSKSLETILQEKISKNLCYIFSTELHSAITLIIDYKLVSKKMARHYSIYKNTGSKLDE